MATKLKSFVGYLQKELVVVFQQNPSDGSRDTAEKVPCQQL